MARVTVEDCLDKVENRFELVMLASKRARQIARQGMDPTVEWENDKATVVALREIAAGNITPEIMQQIEAGKKAEALAAQVRVAAAELSQISDDKPVSDSE